LYPIGGAENCEFANGGTTLFVFWTDATALMGTPKRDQVHQTILNAVSRFPGAVELTTINTLKWEAWGIGDIWVE
jgi:hypothetical protein